MYNLPPKAGRSTFVTPLLLNATTANQCCVCTAKQTGAVSPNLFAFQTSYTHWILVQSSLVFYKKLQGEGKKAKGEHLVDTQISSQRAGMLLWHVPGYSNFYFLLLSFNPFLDKSLNIPYFLSQNLLSRYHCAWESILPCTESKQVKTSTQSFLITLSLSLHQQEETKKFIPAINLALSLCSAKMSKQISILRRTVTANKTRFLPGSRKEYSIQG